MINLSDLKYFYTQLNDNECEINIKLKILKKIQNWIPIKDYIVVTNIGKLLYKLSKLSGELGLQSSIIVNKWKTLMFDNKSNNNNTSNLNGNQFNNINGNLNLNIKSKNISRKTTDDKIPCKKVCLSLKDYYKRKGIDQPEIEDLSVNTKNENELNADLGISFMDSFNVKPVKNKKSKLLKSSEIAALTSTDIISKRNDIIKTPLINVIEVPTEENTTCRVSTIKKIWIPAPKIQTKEPFIIGTQPLSLLKICQNILVTYRNYIEEVEWTPHELLMPVLTLFNVEQLLNFEYFNPHLIEENDKLWHTLTDKKYPDTLLIAKESWRDAFKRVTHERENRMDIAMNNVKKCHNQLKKDEKHAIVLKHPNRYMAPPRQSYNNRHQEYSPYNKVMTKIRQQLKKNCSHLRF